MNADELSERWAPLLADAGKRMAAWRAAHPRATWAEIELAVDEIIDPVRARLLAEAASASSAATFAGQAPAKRPQCPGCKEPLVSRGLHERRLLTRGGTVAAFARTYGECPVCGKGLFPPR